MERVFPDKPIVAKPTTKFPHFKGMNFVCSRAYKIPRLNHINIIITSIKSILKSYSKLKLCLQSSYKLRTAWRQKDRAVKLNIFLPLLVLTCLNFYTLIFL